MGINGWLLHLVGGYDTKSVVTTDQVQAKKIYRRALRARTPNYKLMEFRLNRGWSPAELGRRAGGISPKTVRDIEAGRVRAHAHTLFCLAQALRVKVTDIEPVELRSTM